ncbi:(d)CMP kinase [Peptoniphilus equinus]|uniref:Cytidylate kinase n=1 Tax=Peptoniphilus equinus TaxID=3016343 RepID=A0ABY7QV61_9FIRM|nr:(d)CMP kinase [Peptoniphilus equinus]WBW50607.1 (d)CMP kinase [Peptoniphilus equinus]
MYRVAIDGPSGSGKSTIARELSKRLQITYVDTGAMYRAFALEANNTGKSVDELIATIDIDYHDDTVFLNGKAINQEIRSEVISKMASQISKDPKVRAFLVELQQRIAEKRSVVMEGRDITTVVLPEAEYKFFLDSDVHVRAKRRYEQLIANGESADLEQVYDNLVKRDNNDRNREHSPLTIAEDAVYIDSTLMDLETTVTTILSHIHEA